MKKFSTIILLFALTATIFSGCGSMGTETIGSTGTTTTGTSSTTPTTRPTDIPDPTLTLPEPTDTTPDPSNGSEPTVTPEMPRY